MTLAYLGALLLAALGVGAIDARWRLALFRDAPRAVATVVITALAMLLIDLGGIATGNFRLGESPWMTGFEVLPHLPIEELAFVTFLAYVSIVALCAAERALAARAGRGARAGSGAPRR
ncbi:lycopene cyclase domain-containing protein [Agrococcus sp. Marseille-P2731]|uniref:lycopene cyclase domain-containing protein n=1 Tax=Agrococcus sp. Marseille-P2731 TaxID=1841862 RepID=UPI0009305F52|nr:lycopene cyclase domain-containing protein [Agrococcus sp. Marseille-P2731]